MRAMFVAAICGVLLAGCGSDATTSGDTSPSGTRTAQTEPSKPAKFPEPGEVEVAGTRVTGEWEDGELLGEPLDLGPAGLPYAQLLYAARRPDVNAVSVGVRDDDRILRSIQALTPEAVTEPDGIDLYGGGVLGERGPDERVADGSYLLIGSVSGDVEVMVTHPDGSTHSVTGSSTEVLRGFTVFYDVGDWEDGWDQVQLAPLTVTTNDGRSVAVRERSWTG